MIIDSNSDLTFITDYLLIVCRLKIDPSARPVTYEEILSSPAMTSLPTEVTETEQNFVNQVVLNMPKIDDDED